MKNQKSLPAGRQGISTLIGIIIVVVAAVLIFGGVFAYQYFTKPKGLIYDAKIEQSLANIFEITWNSSGVDKVNIDLFNAAGSEKNRVIIQGLDNQNKYTWTIDDLAAWRSWDGPFKIVISDAINNSVKTEISNFTASGAYPADNYAETDLPKLESLTVWPDVNTFDMASKSFQAKGVRDSALIKNIKVCTNSFTRISSEDMSTSVNDLQEMYSMMKNWVGPEWWFTIKGIMQSDGCLMANEIFIQGQ